MVGYLSGVSLVLGLDCTSWTRDRPRLLQNQQDMTRYPESGACSFFAQGPKSRRSDWSRAWRGLRVRKRTLIGQYTIAESNIPRPKHIALNNYVVICPACYEDLQQSHASANCIRENCALTAVVGLGSYKHHRELPPRPRIETLSFTMSSRKILIIGAGVSGSILAFWLAKHNPNFNITVIERSRANQKLGQGIEIEEPALQVVEAMGIMDRLKEVRTGEAGFQLVDEQARSRAYFGVDGRGSPTGALEIMRGDLTEVLYQAADTFENVTYQFESTVRSIMETGKDKVAVEMQRRGEEMTKTEEFDFVIGADGARSRTRELVMGDSSDWHKPVGAFVAYFSIPKEERDWPNSLACHFTKRRFLWMRPVGKDSKHTSVYLIHINKDMPALREANAAGDRVKQKEIFAELYSDCGWESKRVMKHMINADNFYSDELVQIKLPTWSKGRVALCGDSAWAPTPFTGQGNQLAIIGAWSTLR